MNRPRRLPDETDPPARKCSHSKLLFKSVLQQAIVKLRLPAELCRVYAVSSVGDQGAHQTSAGKLLVILWGENNAQMSSSAVVLRKLLRKGASTGHREGGRRSVETLGGSVFVSKMQVEGRWQKVEGWSLSPLERPAWPHESPCGIWGQEESQSCHGLMKDSLPIALLWESLSGSLLGLVLTPGLRPGPTPSAPKGRQFCIWSL